MNLFEKLNRLDDSKSLAESTKMVTNKKLTEGYRVEPKSSEFNVGDRVAERYNDSEFNVGTIIEIKKDAEGTQYLVKWDYSDREDEEWLYGDVLSLWIDDETEDVYDDNIDEMLTESTEQYELSTLVKDSINHLVNNLGKDPMADDFGDDVCADLEDNYDIYVPENPVKYADWCDAVMCEVSRQLNNKEEQLAEGNNVSSQLPSAIDSFLQDVAQMYGTVTYKDIMKHQYTEEDLKNLRTYRRRFRAEIPYEGEKEADAILKNIAEKVALIVKR